MSAPTTSSSKPASVKGGDGYDSNYKISLDCETEIGIRAAIVGIISIWVNCKRRERIRSITPVNERPQPPPIERSVQPHFHIPIRPLFNLAHGRPFYKLHHVKSSPCLFLYHVLRARK
jgi:hypothetical protein